MLKSKDTVYEIIKEIPADSMVSLSFKQLREFEGKLKDEIIFYSLKHKEKTKDYQRAVLALRWVQGIIRIKTMDTMKGPKNG
jgi:hypothetical protein